MTNLSQPNVATRFSVRDFLAERKALIVHFSTPMRIDDNLRFPDDLQLAQTFSLKGLCCSTIVATDVGPYHPSLSVGGEPNAVGTVGIILDVNDEDSVCGVDPVDCGTSRDPTKPDMPIEHDGDPPTADSCARSIDHRKGNNEWVVKNFRTVGVFVFEPIIVHTLPPGSPEKQIDFENAISNFPDLRIFSAKNGQFAEWDRCERQWSTVEYTSIIEPIKRQ
jgi:hypothetical protein